MDMGKIKKTGYTDGEPNRLGGGGRFKQMVNKGASPALAAYIGRRVLGKKKFQKLAVKGKKDAAKKDTEMNKGIAETKKHEQSESKKFESKE